MTPYKANEDPRFRFKYQNPPDHEGLPPCRRMFDDPPPKKTESESK
eukprot:CAMPEP_0182441466 /NCGR_PEP_ID=MMETSP1172-20130603/439_1 /TAXON_ID=708627 /ORGANISM="Timspurckia oligopyrenoides, Strain CCMP3278" /LENGTH=45 /DNA_ID= /DNA_START= /DNA_END= /DNA_ORIENTATION=